MSLLLSSEARRQMQLGRQNVDCGSSPSFLLVVDLVAKVDVDSPVFACKLFICRFDW